MEFPKGKIDDDRRASYLALHEELGDEGLHALLFRRDPKSAAVIHPHNVKRVIRALEMADEGVSYAEKASGFSHPVKHFPTSHMHSPWIASAYTNASIAASIL